MTPGFTVWAIFSSEPCSMPGSGYRREPPPEADPG
ncbi:hypothetical protein HNR07_004705 [Nocardiopsis metallicus]|uniref:Uncharacterized protein n=1 Tax=Nocardiopsis metallicus TaxID=179819 RepID=A0A840WTU4_9ACTN|nr:hypothetical protein [Nocardiopsis metallicus]